MKFLSPQWRAALIAAAATASATDAAASAAGSSADASAGTTLAVGIEVRDGDELVSWRIVLTNGCIHIDDQPAAVTLVLDRATATDLAQGTLNAQLALTQGRLKIRGDARTLAAADAALTSVSDLFATVRANTEFS